MFEASISDCDIEWRRSGSEKWGERLRVERQGFQTRIHKGIGLKSMVRCGCRCNSHPKLTSRWSDRRPFAIFGAEPRSRTAGRQTAVPMRLAITIPALNEEESIRSIIERSLGARATILERTGLSDFEIIVVSDGSTDRTAEIAREYEDRIHLIAFPENRGYGAAIVAGWGTTDAELLGFLDADGTCDPAFFADLVQVLEKEQADVALGCRLHGSSEMPPLRRVGNRIYAWMLSVFSLSRVRDVASGMRVVRRSALTALFPLPRGLNFTPAMSARAIFSRDLSITEINMPYKEREGVSKLHVLRDGWRFLRVILQTIFLYRPNRVLGFVAVGLIGFSGLMMAGPTSFYLEHSKLEEWMIYRFLVSVLLSSVAVLMVSAGHIARKAADISLSGDPVRARYTNTFGKLVRGSWFWSVPLILILAAVALVWDAWQGYLETGEVYEHWSRFVVMMFFMLLSAILAATKFLDHCLNLLAERLAYLRAIHKAGPSESPSEAQAPPDEGR